MSYVNIEIPDAMKEKVLTIVNQIVENGGAIKKGMNEVTKSIERQTAKLVVIAEDIDPPEIVMHLPMIAEEKKVPYVFVSKKTELGKACNLSISCSAISVTSVPSKVDISELTKQIDALK